MKTPFKQRLGRRYEDWQNRQRLARLTRQVAQHARPRPGLRPIVIFNVSSRIAGMSQNAAFSLLTAWALRLSGVPVVHFVSQRGLSPCVLGTNRQDFTTPPPCDPCIAYSKRLYDHASVQPFTFERDPQLNQALSGLNVDELSAFEYHAANSPFANPIPLGALVLPSIRWALRRHHLPDDWATRYLMSEYIASAYHVAKEFDRLLEDAQPETVLIFNGMMYPEAAGRWAALQRGVRVVTQEVGFQRFSTFFSEGQATAYPTELPEGYCLTPAQEERLDSYLEQRFQGKFTMAGIRFWPEMRGLDEAFQQRAAAFRQVVPIFTNVVYDTSQAHANVVFPHMFAWLDSLLPILRNHPDTLFVIRAHPDEMRPGTAKQSNESVQDWVRQNGVDQMANVVFIPSQEYLSSYELILRSKFVIVYNSSIGLEATLLGKAVVCGGKARYTQYPIVYFPETPAGFRQQVEEFLATDSVSVPAEFTHNARRFLYFQLFRMSIPLEGYLEAGQRQGFVRLRSFSWEALLPQNSTPLQVLVDGLVEGRPFLMPEVL